MSGFQMTIADFTAALDAKRDELAAVNVKIEELQGERQRVAQAAPHTDDITEVFLRGLGEASDTFERQFASYLKSTFVNDRDSAAAASPRNAVHVLRLEPSKPDREELLTRSMKGQTAPELNIGALTYFLHRRIAPEIAGLVERLCPATRDGMRSADRARQLHQIDQQITNFGAERDRIQAELTAARAATAGRSA